MKCPDEKCQRGAFYQGHQIPGGPCSWSECAWPRVSSVTATLAERGTTHGDFTENGKVMQQLKLVMRSHAGWDRLTPAQCEALEMIQHKVGRILCGDPNWRDHWRDIAGYATLAEERCK